MKTRKTVVRKLFFTDAEFTVPFDEYSKQFYGFAPFMLHEQFKSDQEYDFYLSGAMTGVKDHNYPKFHSYAHKLRQVGFRVFNPAENFGGDTSLDRETYMRHDIKAVARSGAIFVLPDYENSEGVATELNVALGLQMPVYIASESDEAQLPLIRKYDSYEN